MPVKKWGNLRINMDVSLRLQSSIRPAAIQISGSKSETNRLLLLQALFPQITLQNISDSDDGVAMQRALAANQGIINVGHAGTAMRFLTAFFAVQPGREVVLTGSPRMKERPVGVLVEALRKLGADIEYTEAEGYPPLKIRGARITGGRVSLKADVSSQYITALLLVAGRLEKGLEITLEGKITSRPYIDMTLSLLKELGIEAEFSKNIITVRPLLRPVSPTTIVIESDWSSASYFYSIVALAEKGTRLELSSFRQDSLQGDAALVSIYRQFGVETIHNGNTISLIKMKEPQPETQQFELSNTPDIAQTIVVTCFGLGIGCHLTGLHTLKIKETDRLEALKAELEKLGAVVTVTGDSLILNPGKPVFKERIAIETYNDHRMAMAFAPLAVKFPIIIKDIEVVSKSYPSFWKDLEKIGFVIKKL